MSFVDLNEYIKALLPLANGDYIFSAGDTDDRAQPSAPVVVCKAFCGMTHAQLALDAQASKDWIADPGYSLPDNRIRWCSPACRDARLLPAPPLAAQPAEAKRRFSEAALKMGCDCPPGLECATCKPFYDAEQSPYLFPCGQRGSTADANRGHVANCANGCNPLLTSTQISEQPKPAAKGHDFSDPYCATSVDRLCLACGATMGDMDPCLPDLGWRERWERRLSGKPTGILNDPTIPERLPRPRLAHSMQWPEEAEDVR